jgi:hypothetical protein
MEMRVTHVINSLGIGGAERALLRLVQDTSGEVSHSIIALTGRDRLRHDFEDVPGVCVGLLGARRGLSGASAVRCSARWLYGIAFEAGARPTRAILCDRGRRVGGPTIVSPRSAGVGRS